MKILAIQNRMGIGDMIIYLPFIEAISKKYNTKVKTYPQIVIKHNCEIKYIDIVENTKAQTKYEITVVPTIIILDDGEEDERYEADISFSMKATLEDVQEVVDDSNMDSF